MAHNKMATGGEEVDLSEICNVCLEPYRGRQPKILACFHTFCLACLYKLVDRETTQTSTDGSEDSAGQSPVSITCPTCRKVIPVPPAGVTDFQANFYVDDSSKQEDAQPAPCHLCDGVCDARYHCHTCHMGFCAECRRYHDKLCRAPQVTELPEFTHTSSSRGAEGSTGGAVKQELQRQRQKVGDVVKKPSPLVHSTSSPQGLGAQSGRGSVPSAQQSSSLTADTQGLHDLYQRLDDFTNRVTMLQTANTVLTQHVTLLSESSSSRIATLEREVTSLKDKNAKLTADQAAMQKEVTALKNKSAKLTGDQAALQREVASLIDKNAIAQQDLAVLSSEKDQLGTDLTTLQQDVVSIHTDNAMLHTDVGQLRTDRDAAVSSMIGVQADLSALQGDNATVKTDIGKLQAEHAAVQSDIGTVQNDIRTLQDGNATVQSEIGTVQNDVKTLQDDNATVKSDISTVQNDIKTLQDDNATVKSDISTVQNDVRTLQGDSVTAKNDISKLKTQNSAMKTDISTTQNHITALQGDNSTLRSDVASSQRQVTSLQWSMQSAQDSLKNKTTKITAIETRLSKAGKQVAFYAILLMEVTTSTVQTLICDGIVTNVGGGYSGQTGEFTAPVSGTYCFMATASPCKADNVKKSRLDIVLEGDVKGYLHSEGYSWSTGHTVVRVTAGQKVWLRTYDGEYIYNGGWWTTFSGMLLQPDV